jgi:hypothetical protein
LCLGHTSGTEPSTRFSETSDLGGVGAAARGLPNSMGNKRKKTRQLAIAGHAVTAVACLNDVRFETSVDVARGSRSDEREAAVKNRR